MIPFFLAAAGGYLVGNSLKSDTQSFGTKFAEGGGVDSRKEIKILTEIESSPSGVYRKFMSTDEVKICNKLVKIGMLYKSKPDEKNATIAFFITGKGRNWLENQK